MLQKWVNYNKYVNEILKVVDSHLWTSPIKPPFYGNNKPLNWIECKLGPIFKPLTVNLKVNMTFKRYSVILDFCWYPCNLSKYPVGNLTRYSHCARAEQAVFLVSYIINWSNIVEIFYVDRSWHDYHFL